MFKLLFGCVVIAVLAGCETVPRQVLPYVAADELGGKDLYLYDLDSGLSLPLLQTSWADVMDPTLDYASQRVAFVQHRTATGQGSFNISIYDLKTSQSEVVFESTDPLFRPAWSNKGKKIAYVVQREGKLQIEVIDLTANTKPKIIGFGSDPSWRVDDRAIFYNSRDTPDVAAGDLMVYDLKTGINQSLRLRGNDFANLSRGTSVVYTTLPYSRRNEAIWIIDANNQQKRLSNPGKTHRDTDPVHINGSKFVAFTRTDVPTGKSSIFVVERYAQDPVETILFEAKGNTFTKGE